MKSNKLQLLPVPDPIESEAAAYKRDKFKRIIARLKPGLDELEEQYDYDMFQIISSMLSKGEDIPWGGFPFFEELAELRAFGYQFPQVEHDNAYWFRDEYARVLEWARHWSPNPIQLPQPSLTDEMEQALAQDIELLKWLETQVQNINERSDLNDNSKRIAIDHLQDLVRKRIPSISGPAHRPQRRERRRPSVIGHRPPLSGREPEP